MSAETDARAEARHIMKQDPWKTCGVWREYKTHSADARKARGFQDPPGMTLAEMMSTKGREKNCREHLQQIGMAPG